MQLLAPDIDGEYQAGAVGEQHFGETAGRCADIEADVILDVDRILLQRARQLDAAARDKGMRGLRLQHGVSGNALGGFHDRLVVGGDEAGLDRGLGPRPAFEQAALDQQQVRAFARGRIAVVPGQVQPDAGAGAEASRLASRAQSPTLRRPISTESGRKTSGPAR